MKFAVMKFALGENSLYFVKDKMKSILKLLVVSCVKDSALVCMCPYLYFFSGACLLPFLNRLIILQNVNIQIKASKITYLDFKILIISIFLLFSS